MSHKTITDQLINALGPLRFGPPVTHVYNPLSYARRAYDEYLARYGQLQKEVVLVGMNPGPWGMVQTGVPFGDVQSVRDWLGIDEPIGKPSKMHPKRPVSGFDCPRREISGRRVWSWASDCFGTPEHFFMRFFIANYCPLAFIEATGRNRTPDKLRAGERKPLFAACDRALVQTVELLSPRYVIGIGAFAAGRVRKACRNLNVVTGRITHPSPANPLANRGWAARTTAELTDLGISLPA